MDAPRKLIVFQLDEARYGLALETVDRVVRAVEPVPLPRAPEIVSGLIDAGGVVLPLLNVRKRLRACERPLRVNDQFILARMASRRVVLWVDAVLHTLEEAGSAIQADQVIPGLEYVSGVVRREDGLVLIHDLDSFLALGEEVELAKALAEGEAGESEHLS